MNNIKYQHIAIVGGGPGGLTLARILQLHGINVKVYERDSSKDARPQGATLDLHDDSGLLALKRAGLMDAFKANYRPGADRMSLLDKDGNILISEQAVANDDATGRPEIDRGPLQQLLLDSLQANTVVWDSQFVSMMPNNDGWQLEFKNGTSVYADIVVAADGANSKIRPYLTSIKSFYSGYTAVEGAIYNSVVASPNIHRVLNGGKIFAFGNDQSLIVSAKGDGSLVFYPCFKTDENWVNDSGIDFNDKSQIQQWFKKEFAGWNDLWLELFDNATGKFVPRPLYCFPLDQTWQAQPNLTILGDAAHLMPPYAGEGVNMAMLDALELSQCLTDDTYPDTLSAIAAFEQKMRTRASAAAQQSMDSLMALHSPDAIQIMMQIVG